MILYLNSFSVAVYDKFIVVVKLFYDSFFCQFSDKGHIPTFLSFYFGTNKKSSFSFFVHDLILSFIRLESLSVSSKCFNLKVYLTTLDNSSIQNILIFSHRKRVLQDQSQFLYMDQSQCWKLNFPKLIRFMIFSTRHLPLVGYSHIILFTKSKPNKLQNHFWWLLPASLCSRMNLSSKNEVSSKKVILPLMNKHHSDH